MQLLCTGRCIILDDWLSLRSDYYVSIVDATLGTARREALHGTDINADFNTCMSEQTVTIYYSSLVDLRLLVTFDPIPCQSHCAERCS